MPEDQAQVLAGSAEHDIDSITLGTFEIIAGAKARRFFMCPMIGSIAFRPLQLTSDAVGDAAFLPSLEDVCVVNIVTTITEIDITTLRSKAGQSLHLLQGVFERMAVVRIAPARIVHPRPGWIGWWCQSTL